MYRKKRKWDLGMLNLKFVKRWWKSLNCFTAWEVSKQGVLRKYGILCKSPYSAQIQENMDQKKIRIWTLFTQCFLSYRIDLKYYEFFLVSNHNLNWKKASAFKKRSTLSPYKSFLRPYFYYRHDFKTKKRGGNILKWTKVHRFLCAKICWRQVIDTYTRLKQELTSGNHFFF